MERVKNVILEELIKRGYAANQIEQLVNPMPEIPEVMPGISVSAGRTPLAKTDPLYIHEDPQLLSITEVSEQLLPRPTGLSAINNIVGEGQSALRRDTTSNLLSRLPPEQRSAVEKKNLQRYRHGAALPSRPQTMTPVRPGLRDRAEMFLGDVFGGTPVGRRRRNMFMDAFEIIPGTGEALLFSDAEEARQQGDLISAGILSGGALLSTVPVAGPVISKVARRAARGAAGRGARGTDPVSQALDRVKLGKEYPEIGTPVPKIDKNTGNPYLGKGVSAEGLLLKQEFGEINPDIVAGNYTPFYEVAERSYVDPSYYNIQGNTLTDKLPKTQKTTDRFYETFGTPEIRGNLNRAYDAGLSPEAQHWYAMRQLEEDFISELGEVEGRRLFKERFADSMAATTGGADPGANLRLASYLNFMKNKGRPFPYVTEGLGSPHIPYPIGAGEFGAKGNVLMYDKVINQGQGLSAFGQPKRFNFSSNFVGDRSRATIDKQMMRLFGKDVDSPPGDSYGVLERILGEEAAHRGLMPANFQDVAWAGTKGIEGKPMIQFVNEAIERTARVTGKTPEEVVRDSLINANSPLYSLLMGAGLGGAALSQRQSQQTQSGI